MAKPYENLKKLREQNKISVRKMASLLNTSPSQLFYLESGKISLSFEWIERFTNIFNCTPADIIGYENLGIPSPNKPTLSEKDTNINISFVSSKGLSLKNIPFTKESLKALNLPTDTQLTCKEVDNKLVFIDKSKKVVTTFTLNYKKPSKQINSKQVNSKQVKIPASITQNKK